MGKRLAAALAAIAFCAMTPAAAQAMPRVSDPGVSAPAAVQVDWRRDRYHGGYRGGGRGWHDRDDHSDAVIAGVAGLATGLLLAQPNYYGGGRTYYGGTYERRVYTPGYPSYVAPYRQPYYSGYGPGQDYASYCFSKYGPSYDPGSNTYLAVNGLRYGCH